MIFVRRLLCVRGFLQARPMRRKTGPAPQLFRDAIKPWLMVLGKSKFKENGRTRLQVTKVQALFPCARRFARLLA
jgi:hypothetical protein